ncbi:GNAT family N-acetyltransferase [uncultured Tateyamaria sp.]|uniref:GNAT family N-acetyltransferase n=1 Tax=uncultured Tateyamaria sp. TaxID=455651 RepID=UPI002622B0C1|nr:GNAT family N-acetyltransferase [uncultured Tateyamaria sp.]
MIPTLTTDRLTLRAPERRDFDAYAAMLADPRTSYMGGPFGRAQAWAEFNQIIAAWHLDGAGGWIITDGTDTLLGEIFVTQNQHFPEPELGWTLTRDAEGHGYAQEAARAVLAWYWANTDATTLVSYVTPTNARSAVLAEKLGAHPDDDAPRPDGENAQDTTVYRHMRGAA